jgi:hypothetical protein
MNNLPVEVFRITLSQARQQLNEYWSGRGDTPGVQNADHFLRDIIRYSTSNKSIRDELVLLLDDVLGE